MITLGPSIPITLKSDLKLLKITPPAGSFISSFGLSLYHSYLKAPENLEAKRTLELFYNYFSQINQLLESNNAG